MHSNLRFFSNRYLRLLLVAIAVAFCVWAIRSTAAFGLSRLYVKYALVNRSMGAATEATTLTPADAQAQITAATISSLEGSTAQTLAAVEKAVALRPADYSLWIALGLTRDQLGDTSGALAAFDQAVKRAPLYSQPYWQRGNLLLRAGQYESAFKDLNYAAQSNPELIPRLIDLAWGLSQGDAALTESMAQIKSPKRRIAFARLLVREGKAEEAVTQWKAAGELGGDIQRDLVRELLGKRSYKEAHTIWRAGRDTNASEPFEDGGFEGPLMLSEEAFGWRVPSDLKGVNLTLDATDRHSGTASILATFQGESAWSSALLSQLALVEPSGHYKLNFAARSKDIVSGGPPIVVVTDPSDGKVLGKSIPLNKGTASWQVFSVEFMTSPRTSAVTVSVQRESCTTSPCPIFGSLSLDSFSLERLK
ncbi:MAG TPA: tetratricopeptide repeat protein [Pyrinomonadaceae bacterium]|nr:tetratricopeptide repeat protein [Pyrinomonadaceae bacterium]